MNVFGTLVTRPMVEREVLRVLKAWEGDYLAAIGEASRGDRAALQRAKRWQRVSRFPTDLPDEQLPFVAIVSPGPTDTPLSDGESYSTRLAVAVGVLAMAGGQNAAEDARDVAGDHGMALAAALVHKGATSDLISAVLYRGETADDGPRGDDDALATSIHAFWIDVDGVLDLYGGPDTPHPDPVAPIPDLGQVEQVEITIDTETPT